MKRRTFLATLAMTPAVLPAPPAASAIPPRPIPIGFLGAAYSHGADKIRLAMNSPEWEFIGVCDDSPVGRAVCERLGAPLLAEGDLLARTEVIAVESEIARHAAHGLLALEAGKHVHLEKPPVTKPEEMEAIVAAARRTQRLLQVGFMWRYNPGFQAIAEAVRQGWLGEVIQVRAFMGNNLSPSQRASWAEFDGGSMFEQGAHLVDATVRLLGSPARVTPFLRNHGTMEDRLRDNNVTVLEFERATAVITNTALQVAGTPHRSFEVIATNGTALLLPVEPPTLVIELASAAGPYHKGKQSVAMPVYERYVGDFAELAAAVRGEKPLTVSLDEELLVAQTVLRAAGMA